MDQPAPLAARPAAMPVRPWSIRGRLTWRVLALVCLAWLGTVILATVFLDFEINEAMDQELEAVAATTVLYLDATPGQVIPRSLGIKPDSGERVLRILRPDEPVPVGPWSPLRNDGFHQLDGWRVYRLTAENALIEVGHNMEWRRSEMFEAASALLLLMLPMMALLVWGLGRYLGQGLAPVEALADSIAARGPEDLASVPEAGLPRELVPLAQGMNQFVARIDQLRRAERQFVANAAHELRTPVATIRAQLELAQDPQIAHVLPQLDNLTRRVERLLQLARSEAGLGLGRGPADLVRITRLLIREVASGPGLSAIDRVGQAAPSGPSATARPVPNFHFDDGELDQLWVQADPDALAILIRNLLENAVEHGSGEVRVSLSALGVLRIRNPLRQPDRPHAGREDRFEDCAFHKRPGSAGSGLGLSIVAELARAMGADVSKDIAAGWAAVSVTFPLESDVSGPVSPL